MLENYYYAKYTLIIIILSLITCYYVKTTSSLSDIEISSETHRHSTKIINDLSGLQPIELGQIIRKSNFVAIRGDQFKISDDTPHLRLKGNYLTVNLVRGNLTVLNYRDNSRLPFTSRGCVPVFYYANNPSVIESRELHLDQDEPWRVIIFSKPVKSIDPSVAIGRNIIAASFSGGGLSREVEELFLESGNMVMRNLVPDNRLLKLTESTLFSGYLLAFDVLTRYSTEMPVLANLVLIDRDHCHNSHLELWSHDFSGHNLPIYPGIPPPAMVSEEEIAFPEHYVTHIDVPYHLTDDGWTTETLPFQRNVVPCVKVAVRLQPDQLQVGIADLQQLEYETRQQIATNSFVFIDTGNSHRWPSASDYMKQDSVTGKLNMFGIDGETTRWLIEHRHIVGLGIDSMSTDGTKSATLKSTNRLGTHIALAQAGIVGLENAAYHYSQIHADHAESYSAITNYWCVFVHLRVQRGTGSPVAIFAHLPTLIEHANSYDAGTGSESISSFEIANNNNNAEVAAIANNNNSPTLSPSIFSYFSILVTLLRYCR